jgi:hypothetical protein
MARTRRTVASSLLTWKNIAVLVVGVAIVSIVIGAILGSSRGLSESQKQALSAAAADITKVRAEAEQWAHRIKNDYQKSSIEYQTAYGKYIPAKAATDAWLDRFAVDLAAHRDISGSSEYKASLNEAADKGEEFISYVSGLYSNSLREKAVPDLLTPMTDVALKVWKEFRNASKEAIEDVNKQLQLLKWKPFDQA